MSYVVYILEDQTDKTWYIGFTHDLKQRLKDHKSGHSPYTSKKKDLKLIYAKMYLNKTNALGRERFLKSGSGHRFVRYCLYFLSSCVMRVSMKVPLFCIVY